MKLIKEKLKKSWNQRLIKNKKLGDKETNVHIKQQ